jgi:hypothetical protein
MESELPETRRPRHWKSRTSGFVTTDLGAYPTSKFESVLNKWENISRDKHPLTEGGTIMGRVQGGFEFSCNWTLHIAEPTTLGRTNNNLQEPNPWHPFQRSHLLHRRGLVTAGGFTRNVVGGVL